MTRVGIVAKTRLQRIGPLLEEIARWLEERGATAVFETATTSLLETETAAGAPPPAPRATFDRDVLPLHVDLVLVLGGDGTLLGMADRIAEAGASIPILGVNFGSLGFLTEITLPELYPALDAALTGHAAVSERLMLRARLVRAGRVTSAHLVLNDVVMTKGALARIVDFSVSVDEQFVARFKADGLIVATPTGSTAYNLAAGGPIVHPAAAAMALTPIAPHTLTNRPIVIPSSATVRVQPLIDDGNDEMYVTFDGQVGVRLHADDMVEIASAEHPLRLIRASTRSYFEVLRQKLKWGER